MVIIHCLFVTCVVAPFCYGQMDDWDHAGSHHRLCGHIRGISFVVLYFCVLYAQRVLRFIVYCTLKYTVF